MKSILVADIGGTNSRFAHFVKDNSGALSMVDAQWLETAHFTSFSHLLEGLNKTEFSLMPDKADIAVIAIAGPVEDGIYSAPPFISWDINISNSLQDFSIKKCFLINDFVAQAFACRSPIAEFSEEILHGRYSK